MVLVAEEFWNLIGGDGTYAEVLEIYRQVGHDLGPTVWDKLVG
jgi:hypothetical protein